MVCMIVDSVANSISQKDEPGLIKHMHVNVSFYLWPSVVHVCRRSAIWNQIGSKKPHSWHTSNIRAAGTPAYHEAWKTFPQKISILFTNIAMKIKITRLTRGRVKRHMCLLEMLWHHRHYNTRKMQKMYRPIILTIWRYVYMKHDVSMTGWVHWYQNGKPWLPLFGRWRITALGCLPTPIFTIAISVLIKLTLYFFLESLTGVNDPKHWW